MIHTQALPSALFHNDKSSSYLAKYPLESRPSRSHFKSLSLTNIPSEQMNLSSFDPLRPSPLISDWLLTPSNHTNIPSSVRDMRAEAQFLPDLVPSSKTISTCASVHEDDSSDPPSPAPESTQLVIRGLITSRDAGVIIGKDGKNVAELREATGVKAGVSKVVPGVNDRILTLTGTIDGVSKAYSIIAKALAENSLTNADAPHTTTQSKVLTTSNTFIRILITHNLMGTIIGRQGLKIKNIQDMSGARLIASKELLPNSTERIVEIQGSIQAIRLALHEVGKCITEDWERGINTIHYSPASRLNGAHHRSNSTSSISSTSSTISEPIKSTFSLPHPKETFIKDDIINSEIPLRSAKTQRTPISVESEFKYVQEQLNRVSKFSPPNTELTSLLSIPSDLVGCVIGKGGSKISEIRRLSGSKISISKGSQDESDWRLFTIVGDRQSTQLALDLLQEQIFADKKSL
jgi:heterogeneous nuclear rnp K-like protein 2